jgi:hypothetical protein
MPPPPSNRSRGASQLKEKATFSSPFLPSESNKRIIRTPNKYAHTKRNGTAVVIAVASASATAYLVVTVSPDGRHSCCLKR